MLCFVIRLVGACVCPKTTEHSLFNAKQLNIRAMCCHYTPQPKSADVYVQALRRHGNAVPACLTQRRHDDVVFFCFCCVATVSRGNL